MPVRHTSRAVLTCLTALTFVGCHSCGGQETPMNEDDFWEIIDTASREISPAAKEEAIRASLRRLGEEQLVAYSQHWDAKMAVAYHWRLWAAAYVLGGGCSDDCFMDFRSSIILLGRGDFHRVLRDPDELVSIIDGMDEPADLFHENYGYPFHEVWEEKMGADAPLPPNTQHPTEPAGNEWAEEDLPEIVPALSRRFGPSPIL